MAVRNTLMDMHNILMEQLERLMDDELTDEELDKEIKRSKAVGDTAKVIVDNSRNLLDAQKIRLEYGEHKKIDTASIFIENKKE